MTNRSPGGKPPRSKSGWRTKTPQVLFAIADQKQGDFGASYLHYAGFHVDVVSESEHLDARLRRTRPSVVIVDASLAGSSLTGSRLDEAARRLKGLLATDEIPLILLAELGEEPDAPFSEEWDEIVSVPYAPQQLVACVMRALSGARKAADSER